MKIKTQAISIHELGKRANQEDSLYPDQGDAPFSSDLYILCDGMGGHSLGEVASSTVCAQMSSYIGKNCPPDEPFTVRMFEAALEAAYDELDRKDDGADRKMGTTLTFLKFHPGGCLLAYIGDSRIYQVRPSEKRIVLKTKDHSLLNDLLSLGELDEESAKTFTQKNVITRAVQAGQERRSRADIFPLTDIEEGDYFYMCSDGMLEEMTDENILNILSMTDKDDVQKRDILRRLTTGSKDNHTAHIIRVVSVEDEEATGSGPSSIPGEEKSGGNDTLAAQAPQPTGEQVREDSSEGPSSAPEPQPSEEPRPGRKKGKAWLWVLLILVVCCLAAAAYFFLGRGNCPSAPESTDTPRVELPQDEGSVDVTIPSPDVQSPPRE